MDLHQMAYVANRNAGHAAAYIETRSRIGARNPYTSAEEMLDHLAKVFRNPQRRRIAQHQFDDLKMKRPTASRIS